MEIAYEFPREIGAMWPIDTFALQSTFTLPVV